MTADRDQTYIVAIDGYRGQSGAYELQFQIDDPNAGNRCQDAIEINASGVLQGNTRDFENTVGGLVPCTGYAWTGPDVFYRVALRQGQRIRITDPQGNGWDSGIYIFRDCANPAGTCIRGCDSRCTIDINAPADGVYYFSIDGYVGQGGAYELQVTID